MNRDELISARQKTGKKMQKAQDFFNHKGEHN